MPHRQVVVVAPVVVLDGLLFRTPGHHVVIELTPLATRCGRESAVRGSEPTRQHFPAVAWAEVPGQELPRARLSGAASTPASGACSLGQPCIGPSAILFTDSHGPLQTRFNIPTGKLYRFEKIMQRTPDCW